MTPQEALTYFKHRLDCGQCGENTTQRFAFVEAIKALEKQIPQKPNVKKWVALDDAVYTYHCPHCDVDYNKYYIGSHHCKFCGQAIDWSDNNG